MSTDQRARELFVGARWDLLKRSASAARLLNSIDIMLETMQESSSGRDLDYFELGRIKLFDAAADEEITCDEGFEALLDRALRVKANGSAWFHLPDNTWMPWQKFNRKASSPFGNFQADSLVCGENLRMKNTCILVALLWLRGANVFVAMRARSLQKFWGEFVGLKDAGALQFMIATGWDYGGGGECVRMDVFSNKDDIMNVKGDLASGACFEAYSTTAMFIKDIVHLASPLANGDSTEAFGIQRWAVRRDGVRGLWPQEWSFMGSGGPGARGRGPGIQRLESFPGAQGLGGQGWCVMIGQGSGRMEHTKYNPRRAGRPPRRRDSPSEADRAELSPNGHRRLSTKSPQTALTRPSEIDEGMAPVDSSPAERAPEDDAPQPKFKKPR